MTFPQKLTERLDKLLKDIDNKELVHYSRTLSERYRNQKWLLNKNQKLCYAAFRMPATYAVISHLTQNLSPTTILDVGAGPGTAAWAFKGEVTAVEKDREFMELGKALGSPSRWIEGDYTTWTPDQPYDLVLFSYSYGEVKAVDLTLYWNQCQQNLLIIEPGTPAGWENILRARDALLSVGAHIWAPCPHHNACPLEKPDWCHFGVKLDRSPLHRRLKEGILGYEEEKFSYLLVGRTAHPCHSRVLRPPRKRTGHIHLKLCTKEGLNQLIVSKRQKDLLHQARRLGWGEEWTN